MQYITLIIHEMLRKKGKATQKDKATQHNSLKAVIFQRKSCLGWDSNPWLPLSRCRSYQLSYRDSSAGWVRITYTMQSNQAPDKQLNSHVRVYNDYVISFRMYVHSTYIVCPCMYGAWCMLQVEVTKFEDLEETHAEVRLKQALWKSQKDWATDYESWLNVSNMTQNTMQLGI